jgi:hypothetical protein
MRQISAVTNTNGLIIRECIGDIWLQILVYGLDHAVATTHPLHRRCTPAAKVPFFRLPDLTGD